MKELNELILSGEVIKSDSSDKYDFLNKISDYLIEKGYVIPKFKDKIIKREKQFPTGLITKTINISIPHSETEYVLKEGIIVVIYPDKIKFNRMDKPDEEIEVEVSFILLLKDKNKHIKVLQQLSELLQSDKLYKIRNCKSRKDVQQLLKEIDKS